MLKFTFLYVGLRKTIEDYIGWRKKICSEENREVQIAWLIDTLKLCIEKLC